MALRQIKGGTTNETKAGASSILYVEDEDLNWHITERHLRDGYALTRARDARETFEHLSKQRFDLILMDIQLAGSNLDGIQITRILKGTYLLKTPDDPVPLPGSDQIPIVFVTAYGSRYSRNSLLLLGAADVIYKPVSFVALTECITRLTQRESRRKPKTPPPAEG